MYLGGGTFDGLCKGERSSGSRHKGQALDVINLSLSARVSMSFNICFLENDGRSPFGRGMLVRSGDRQEVKSYS